MEETLTQKSRRRENADVAIALLKSALITACYENHWRGAAFWSIQNPSSDVDADLKRLCESGRTTTEAEKAVFLETRSKVADLRAYLEGRPTNLSSVDEIGWVKRLKSVFEDHSGQDHGDGTASTVQEGGPGGDGFERQKVYGGSDRKPASGRGDGGDGFERQKMYGGLGGSRKD